MAKFNKCLIPLFILWLFYLTWIISEHVTQYLATKRIWGENNFVYEIIPIKYDHPTLGTLGGMIFKINKINGDTFYYSNHPLNNTGGWVKISETNLVTVAPKKEQEER